MRAVSALHNTELPVIIFTLPINNCVYVEEEEAERGWVLLEPRSRPVTRRWRLQAAAAAAVAL